MLEAAEGTWFTVIFFDRERETPVGNIRVNPMEVYKTFQNNISQLIGISPNHISIFLVDHKSRCKHPITAKSNFAQVCGQRDCVFLAVLKRGRPKPNVLIMPPPFHYLPPPNVPLLPYPLVNHQFLPEFAVPQQYFNPHSLVHPNSNVGFPGIEPMMIMDNPVPKFCKECAIAEKNGEAADFHHCVNDVVVKEFRPSPFGPIGPFVFWSTVKFAEGSCRKAGGFGPE